MVTLAERYGGVDVTPDIYEAMVAEVAALIAPFSQRHGGDGLRGIHMLGTVRHGDDNRRRAPQPQALRPQPLDGCWMSAAEITACWSGCKL